MQCPDCGGKGNKPRPETSDEKQRVFAAFPMICDRCSGTGDVPAAKPVMEGQAVYPAQPGGC